MADPIIQVIRRPASLIDRFYDLPLMVVLVALVLGVGVLRPTFLNQYSLQNIGTLAAYFGTMSFGMVFLLSMREIDLSVGAIFGLSVVVAASLMEYGVTPWLAAGMTLIIGALLGLVNASIANALRIQTIIVTLGTLSIYRAIALIISGDRIVTGDLPTSDPFFVVLGGGLLGIPTAIWMFISAAIVLHIVYRYTPIGFDVRAIGSNADAARLAGISLPRRRMQALMLQGFLCSLAAVVSFAYLEAGDPVSGTGFELYVIAAAIIGGTALSGGQGSIFGALIGSLDHRRHHDRPGLLRIAAGLGSVRDRVGDHRGRGFGRVPQASPHASGRAARSRGDRHSGFARTHRQRIRRWRDGRKRRTVGCDGEAEINPWIAQSPCEQGGSV